VAPAVPYARSSATPAGYPRGAAAVPPAQTRQERPPAYVRQAGPVPSTPEPRRSRPGMVLLAILLAVLVLVCSGVISYNLRKQSLSGGTGALAAHTVTSGALRLDERDDPTRTSYRREVRLQPGDGGTTTSEGRQTR
ncbi:serine/threonine protein kinase, partial [Micromonospora sp. STR1_7]|nr:serine/threonine protein kinase [Micromonospora parastrephiae]